MTRPAVANSATSPNGAAAAPVGAGGGTPDNTAPSGGWGLPLAVLVAGMFMSVLDISIVNVAIPTIQNDFGATTDDVQWVVTGYTLALGVVVPVTAWLGDRFGLSRVYNLALLAFAAGSALCGLAWDLEQPGGIPDHSGDPRRDPAGDHAVDPVPDRAPGAARRRHGPLRPGYRLRPGGRPDVWAATSSSTWTGG